MPTRLFSRRTGLHMLAMAAATTAMLGTSVQAQSEDDILIGASIPISGPLAGFGSYLKWGYERAVNEVNAAGGIDIDGTARMVSLIIRDDKTDPNVGASNVETLISRDGVVAMLGSSTPPLVASGGLVAERNRIPYVTASAPLESFKAVRNWNYAWDIFFHEPELGSLAFRMITDLNLETNRKIAILHDNGPDGEVVGGQAWPAIAADMGFEVVSSAGFPVDNMQFTTVIAEAKAANADIVLVMSSTPQAVAIRKQMASAGYAPKILVMERGGEPTQFAEALGELSDGVLVGGYWDPSFPFPGAADLSAAFEAETGQTTSQHIADSYAAAQVLLDAIAAAGSTDAEAINDAIAATDKTYVVGPISFDEFHTAKLPVVQTQWQGGRVTVVWPPESATGELMFPLQ